MAWTYVASSNGYSSSTSGTSWDCPTSLDVSAGDLLVSVFGWRGGALTNFKIADDDGSTNEMTNLAEALSAFHGERMAYKIAASASTGSIFRVSHSESVAYRRILVLQFRPDTGDTVTLEASSTATQANTTAPMSGQLSAIGDDLLAIGGVTVYQSRVMSAFTVAGSASSGELVNTYASAGWSMFTSSQTDIAAGCTLATAGNWIAQELIFKATASAGGVSIPVIMSHLMNQGIA